MTSFYILAFFHGLVCAAGDELSNVASLSSYSHQFSQSVVKRFRVPGQIVKSPSSV